MAVTKERPSGERTCTRCKVIKAMDDFPLMKDINSPFCQMCTSPIVKETKDVEKKE